LHADEAPRCESLHTGADVFRAADQQRTARQHLICFWCRSEIAPTVGYWSRNFLGWCVYNEACRLSATT
jgi:hypothetical protein